MKLSIILLSLCLVLMAGCTPSVPAQGDAQQAAQSEGALPDVEVIEEENEEPQDPKTEFLLGLDANIHGGIFYSSEDGKVHIIPVDKDAVQKAIDAVPQYTDLVIDTSVTPAYPYQKVLDAQLKLDDVVLELNVSSSRPDLKNNRLVVGSPEWTEESKKIIRELAAPVEVEFEVQQFMTLE